MSTANNDQQTGTMNDQPVADLPLPSSSRSQLLPNFDPTRLPPSPFNDRIRLQTDFTTSPPSYARGNRPQQVFSNPWQTRFVRPLPAPQTFSSYGNSTAPLPRQRFNSGQRTHYSYGNTQRNNRPRQFFQNANEQFLNNSPQIPQTLSSSSSTTHYRPQFNKNLQFLPKEYKRMKRPQNSVQNPSNRTDQETNAGRECKTRKHKLKPSKSCEPKQTKKFPWNREDAIKAFAVETELREPKNNQYIMIKFPDHIVTREIIHGFDAGIKSVSFPKPVDPRYCYVKIKPNANIESVANDLKETLFQHEKLQVEIKKMPIDEEVKDIPECIDPFTLYLGNLPSKVGVSTVKNEFPKAFRIDVGFGKKMKKTRYAFIKFSSGEDAIQALKDKYNLVIDNRSVILRFKRNPLVPTGKVNELANEINEFGMEVYQKKK